MAVIGLGASGCELARRARAFGMRVLGVDVAEFSPQALTEMGVESCAGIEGLFEVLGQVDVVSLHLPLIEQTRHVIDATAFAAMKPARS